MTDGIISKLIALVSGGTVAVAAVPVTGSLVTATAAGVSTAALVNGAAEATQPHRAEKITFHKINSVSKPQVASFDNFDEMMADANRNNAKLIYGAAKQRTKDTDLSV